MVKCGKCKGEHATAADVQACYAGHGPSRSAQAQIATAQYNAKRSMMTENMFVAPGIGKDDDEAVRAAKVLNAMASKGKPKGEPMWPASPKQKDYIKDLQGNRILPVNYEVLDDADIDRLDKDEASSLITLLKSFPWTNEGDHGQPATSMPEGRYALLVEGEWWFFQVDKPMEGRWKGYTFIKRLIGAPGDYRKVDLDRTQRMVALRMIGKDPKQAMINYGLESKECGRCHSPLTDPASIARGLGPICAAKSGWF